MGSICQRAKALHWKYWHQDNRSLNSSVLPHITPELVYGKDAQAMGAQDGRFSRGYAEPVLDSLTVEVVQQAPEITRNFPAQRRWLAEREPTEVAAEASSV